MSRVEASDTASVPKNNNISRVDSDAKYLNSTKDFRPTKFEDFGYFFYPQRFGNVHKSSWYEKMISYSESRDLIKRKQCEYNVEKAIETRWSPFGITLFPQSGL